VELNAWIAVYNTYSEIWRKAMVTPTQQKVKPTVYTDYENEAVIRGNGDPLRTERVVPVQPQPNSGSGTTVTLIIAAAIIVALGYFYLAGNGSRTVETPPATTQETVPAPAPSDPAPSAPAAPAN
jgi:hypothetical protein